jgi:hypothetical protein
MTDADIALSEMDRQLAVIRDLLARKRALAAAAEADVEALARLRWEVTRALLAYQRYKHLRLFDPAIASGDPGRAAQGRELKLRCIAAGELFRAYAARWAPSGVGDRWAEYRTAAEAMIADLEARLDRERDDAERLVAPRLGRAA